MNLISPNKIIIKPIITEKSILGRESGKYSFWVEKSASKNQIAQAFKAVFNIEPLTVNTVKVFGKTKTDWKKHFSIKKQDRKKAIISIPKDKKIEALTLKTK